MNIDRIFLIKPSHCMQVFYVQYFSSYLKSNQQC